MTVPDQSVPAPDQRDELLIEHLDPREHPEFAGRQASSSTPPAGPAEEAHAEEGFDGDQQDLADRISLRRVAGMSTELTDITEVEYRQLLLERVVLVSVWTTGTAVDAENSLAELKLLAETAGSQILEGLIQRRGRPDPATLHRQRQGRGAA